MIKNAEELERFEREYDRAHPLTLEQKYALLESMYQLGKQFGHFTPARLMEGMEVDIAMAKALNANLSNPPRTDSSGV